jgi:hypothetical protein
MRLAAAEFLSLSTQIDVYAAEFSITAFCRQNPASRKSSTYAREPAKIGPSLFDLSLNLHPFADTP